MQVIPSWLVISHATSYLLHTRSISYREWARATNMSVQRFYSLMSSTEKDGRWAGVKCIADHCIALGVTFHEDGFSCDGRRIVITQDMPLPFVYSRETRKLAGFPYAMDDDMLLCVQKQQGTQPI